MGDARFKIFPGGGFGVGEELMGERGEQKWGGLEKIGFAWW